MSEARNKDHWRELAELLGLPPDEKGAPEQPEVYNEHRDSGDAPKENTGSREWQPAPADLTDAEPIGEDSFEPAPGERSFHEDVSRIDEAPAREFFGGAPDRELPPSASLGHGLDREREEAGDEPEPERRRGRRRGRRGRRDDSRERDERDRKNRAPRAERMERDLDEIPPESADASEGQAIMEEASDPFRGEIEQSPDEEDFDMAGTAATASVEQDDDEEVDKLTDWNVPSWSELIASLYRPER